MDIAASRAHDVTCPKSHLSSAVSAKALGEQKEWHRVLGSCLHTVDVVQTTEALARDCGFDFSDSSALPPPTAPLSRACFSSKQGADFLLAHFLPFNYPGQGRGNFASTAFLLRMAEFSKC